MKKVMIGILILIPILILVIVMAVTSFLRVHAVIGVDSIKLVEKGTKNDIDSVTVMFPSEDRIHDFNDFVDIIVTPDYANNYSVGWRITDITCMDAVYDKSYKQYLEDLKVYNEYLAKANELDSKIAALVAEGEQAQKDLEAKLQEIENDWTIDDTEKPAKKAEAMRKAREEQAERDSKLVALRAERAALHEPELLIVDAPATFVDENGHPVTSNTTGKFVVNSYCSFTVVVDADGKQDTLYVTAEGYNVESVTVVDPDSNSKKIEMLVGENKRMDAKYAPLSSLVTKTRWHSDNPAVISIDDNGVVTALGVGKANIWVEANVYDRQDDFVASEKYPVEVKKGVSKFGAQFSTAKSEFALADIGVDVNDVINYSGCTINAGKVTMKADTATIFTLKANITVNKCASGSISIQNANIFDDANGYVFASSELPLTLKAIWTDVFEEEGAPFASEVVWETSNSAIATVENGVVKAVAGASGYVDITAKLNGKTAKIKLNVQKKLVSMQLRTSNSHFAVGLARETVFAAEKYADETYTTKVANSLYIQIIGEPQRLENESLDVYNSRLRAYYNSFKYEITAGGEFAYFENTEENEALFPNKLIFIPSALEGKGKQQIVVKVSAKYPKYESETQFTTEVVTLNVIYGVEVDNIAAMRAASQDQYDYAHAEGNYIARALQTEIKNTIGGITDRYRVYNAESSKKTYAICVVGNIAFEADLQNITDSENIRIYGDLYGNGHMLSAERNQINNVSAMIWVAWSNVTVSNFNIRANKLEKDGMLSANDTDGLTGECFQVFVTDHNAKGRVVNVTIEYGIFENAKRAGQTYNADVTFKGVVMRNILSTAMYVPARMRSYTDDDGNITVGPVYSHLTYHNCVFSNCVSTIGSYAYERFTVMPKPGHSDETRDDYKAGQGRFVRDDPVANEAFFRENFLKEGINTQVRQTGFMDVYNWTDVNGANLIETGDKKTDELIGAAAGVLIGSNSLFANARYYDAVENKWYFHMGMVSTGISFGEGIFDEPIYFDVTFEDNRFGEPIETKKIKNEGNALLENAIREFGLKFYCYRGDADITPFSAYEINDKFIERLHG